MNDSNLRKVEDSDKKNVFRSALALFTIGICLFALLSLNYPTLTNEYLYIYAVPITYILSGVLGILSTFTKIVSIVKAYLISLIVLMIFNSLIVIAGVMMTINLLLNPNDCDSSVSEDCGLAGFFYFLAYVGSILSIFISSSIAGLCYVFYGYTSRFKNYLSTSQYSAFSTT